MEDKIPNLKIQEIAEKIISEFKPEKIILFGSYAWGNPNPESDVDLFIVKESDDARRVRQIKLRALLFPPALPMDLLVYTPRELKKRLDMGDYFVKEIISNGKVLYESK